MKVLPQRFCCSVCDKGFPTSRQFSSHLGRFKGEEKHQKLYEGYVNFVKNLFDQGKSQKEIINHPKFPFNIGFVQTVWKTLDKKQKKYNSLKIQKQLRKQRFALPDKIPSKEELVELYVIQKLSCKEIAQLYGCNVTTIESWILRKYKLNKKKAIQNDRESIILTNEQRSILLGTALGDAHIRSINNKLARMYLSHGWKQQTYLEWKVAKVQELFPFPIRRRKRKVVSYSVESILHSYLKKLHSMIYWNNQKHIPKSFLDCIDLQALAIWYLDDGSLSRDLCLHVCAFDPQEIDNLIVAFKEQLDIHAVRSGKNRRYTIGIYRKNDVQKFLDLIRPYVCDFMAYKVDFEKFIKQKKIYRQKRNKLQRKEICKECQKLRIISAKGLCRTCYARQRREICL